MKIIKLIEHKNGSATLEIEMDKKERDFCMELGVNEMIRERLRSFEEDELGMVNHEPPKPKKRKKAKK